MYFLPQNQQTPGARSRPLAAIEVALLTDHDCALRPMLSQQQLEELSCG